MLENLDTTSGRLAHVRVTYGRKGRKGVPASVRGFAKEMGTTHGKARQWEEGRLPQRGLPELVECLGRVEGVRAAGVSPAALAAWVLTGQGEMPTPASENGPPTNGGGAPIVRMPASPVSSDPVGRGLGRILRLCQLGERIADVREIHAILRDVAGECSDINDQVRARGLTVKAVDSYSTALRLLTTGRVDHSVLRIG